MWGPVRPEPSGSRSELCGLITPWPVFHLLAQDAVAAMVTAQATREAEGSAQTPEPVGLWGLGERNWTLDSCGRHSGREVSRGEAASEPSPH
jgi:hypothetical protein